MEITEAYINSIAPNVTAYKNGVSLVKDKSFTKLYKSSDESFIFGECMGSAKTPYFVSADYITDEPVFRCTCPSRQFPCKHALGLLYAYLTKQSFEITDIPQDILDRREKAKQKKKKETASDETPKIKKVNKSAEKKKIATQLEGLDILEKMICSIIKDGFYSIDGKKVDFIKVQSKQLGNYYINGAQTMLYALLETFKEENTEISYQKSMVCITRIYAFIKKAKEYLNNKLNDPELRRDTNTDIEALIGYAWQLADLEEAGLYEDNAELVQLSFTSYDDHTRDEYVDKAIYISLKDGRLYKTYHYRPYKAVKYIREEDSNHTLIRPQRLYLYPGGINRRVRWEQAEFSELAADKIEIIKSKAAASFAEAIKEVKNTYKNLLADKAVYMLLSYRKIVIAGDSYALEDSNHERITISPESMPLIISVQGLDKDGTVLVAFGMDDSYSRIVAKPLSFITDNGILEIDL